MRREPPPPPPSPSQSRSLPRRSGGNLLDDRAGRVVLCLGPTNTGKTHRALDRMLEHDSGMLGLPLRLLARELYDRICVRVGQTEVALITGEERRIPRAPRYFVCTAEAMPLEKEVDFLCVDEIQLAAHPERGHVFTDRLLHCRGREETWFLGSDAMLELCQLLVPEAEVLRSVRLSVLRSEGPLRMGTLKPRAALVAFSMNRVYELAERIKARRGGVAVVLGALSPRARNAQVAMYEAGEVDYLVATDAIGMGLNLDLQRVVFTETRKFDGRELRDLSLGELSQIAGRAGRHHRDGFFGTFAPKEPFSPAIVHALEEHRIPAVRSIYYRNRDLDFSTLACLDQSLRELPPRRCLDPVPLATDWAAFAALKTRPNVQSRATSPTRVALLWEVCQVPDYRKLLLTDHVRLLEELFVRLIDGGVLGDDYFSARAERLRQHQADLDSILPRLAACRTLSYIAGRPDWVAASQARCAEMAEIEDALSDALHAALTERFVVRRGKGPAFLPSRSAAGGRLSHRDVLSALHARLVEPGPQSFARQVSEATHEAFSLDAWGRISVAGRLVARLTRGQKLWSPDFRLELTSAPGEEHQLRRRLCAAVLDLVADALGPLRTLPLDDLSPAARGLCYQLKEGLGAVHRKAAHPQVVALTPEDRRLLARAGLQLGRRTVHFPELLQPDALTRRSALSTAFFGVSLPREPGQTLSLLRASPAPALVALALGFLCYDEDWIRADVAERILATAQDATQETELAHVLGIDPTELERLRRRLGGARAFGRRPKKKPRPRHPTG